MEAIGPFVVDTPAFTPQDNMEPTVAEAWPLSFQIQLPFP